jgi:Tol biopolymer transport system component
MVSGQPRLTRMLVRLLLVMAILVSIGLVALPAAGASGWGVDTATAPVNTWLPLDAGDSPWYAFHYAGDGSQIEVRLQVQPKNSTGFVLWTPELIEQWGKGQPVDPVGRGSDDPFVEGTLTWSGSFTTAGTYYVVVEQAEGQPGTSYYLLQIEGDGVSLPAPAPAEPSTSDSSSTSGSSSKAQPKSSLASELGGKLVFQDRAGGGIYTVNANGSDLQYVTTGIDPAWSSDGTQIAFTRYSEPRGVWVVTAPDGTGSWASDKASSEGRVFDWTEARWPSWSPDGEQVLFSRQYGSTPDRERCFRGRCIVIPGESYWRLAIVDPDDGSLTEPPGPQLALAPNWSPDGEQIVYAGERGLVIQSVDGQASYRLTDDPLDTSPVWSPDGSQVAFVRRQHDHWELYAVDADGGNLTRLTDTPAQPGGQMASSVSPAWSPDGQYIAFYTNRAGQWEIWVMKADGRAQAPMFDTELDHLVLEYTFGGERLLSWTW